MPRKSGFTSKPSSSRSTATAQRPMQSTQQSYAPSKPGMFSGLGGMIMQGMAFGAGSEVAHQAIRSVTGSGSHSQQAPAQQQQQQVQQPKQQMCNDEMSNFSTCLKSQSDISRCQPYMDMLKQCQSPSYQ